MARSSVAALPRSRHLAVVVAVGVVVVAIEIVVLGAALAACAGAPPRSSSSSSSSFSTAAACGGLTLTVRGPSAGVDRGADVATVARGIPSACAALARWGIAPARAPVVVVHGSVDAFVAATGQTTDTLRAWSTPDAVHLLTLEAWQRVDDDAVLRRLTHELCHVGLFQRHGEAARRIPRALGEGLCSVVAGQGDERVPLDEVRRRVAAGEVVDFAADSPFAYGVAHHVVARIATCSGDEALLPLIDAVAAGQTVAGVLGAPPLSVLEGCPPATGGVESRD